MNALWPWQRRALTILAVAGLVVGPWLIAVHSVHAARAERQARCQAELRALKASAFVQRFFVPADPCRAIEIVAKESAR